MNLYTNGGEYAIIQTGEVYTGYYYKLYTGKAFTGHTPNDAFPQQLTPILQSNEDLADPVSNTKVYVALFTGDPDPILVGNPELFPWKRKNIVEYLKLIGQNPDTIQAKNAILSYVPKPTPEQYKLGQFFRYFTKKKNENIYTETNQDTYTKIIRLDKTIDSKYYQPFRLLWQIAGTKDDAGRANKRMTLYAEKTLKFVGLQKFLREDYTSYFKYSQASNLYTPGGEFKTRDGKDYIGDYHIHDNKGPMVGATHIKELHGLLFPVNEKNTIRVTPQTTGSYTIPSISTVSPGYSGGGSMGGGGGSGGGGGY